MKILNNQFIRNLLFITLSVLAIIFFILLINVNNELDQLRNKHKTTRESYNKEKKEFIAENKRNEKLFPNNNNISTNIIYLNNNDIKDMKKKGLSNPVQEIISNLRKHRELIPYKGILGGTMGFYDKKSIWILTNKWVLAYFEDGHIGGYLLLEYNIDHYGKINWNRIGKMRN